MHIGIPKTGTTAIQRHLAQVAYRNRSMPFRATELVLLFGDEIRKKDIRKRLAIGDDDRAMAILRQAIRAAAPGPCVISSEFLYDASINGDPTLLADDLACFGAVTVMLYLRHPLSHFPSLISQRVKSGQHDVEKIHSVPVKMYRYHEQIEKWAARFDVKVRDYQRNLGNLLSDFSTIAGIPQPGKPATLSKVNQGFGRAKIELTILLNRFYGTSDAADHAALVKCAEALAPADAATGAELVTLLHGLPGLSSRPDRRDIVRRLEEIELADTPMTLDAAKREKLMEIAAEVDRALVGRYLDAPLLLAGNRT